MADLYIHLAVAKRYVEKHGGTINTKDFYDGNVIPDLDDDKEITHYGKRGETDLLKRNLEKVNLKKFLEFNTLDSDLNRGKFLHLITDWEYYNNFVPKDRIRAMSFAEYGKSLTYARALLERQLVEKYDLSMAMVSFKDELKNWDEKWKREDSKRYGNEKIDAEPLYNAQDLDEFIERVSSVNLEKMVIANS